MNILSQYRFLLLLPNAHPPKINETAQETHKVLKSYPPPPLPKKLFFSFHQKGEIKTEKKGKKTSSTMNTEEKKSIGQTV